MAVVIAWLFIQLLSCVQVVEACMIRLYTSIFISITIHSKLL